MKKIKQLEVIRTIAYQWCRKDGKAINPDHIEALKERADEMISDKIPQRYASGQLIDNIYMGKDDPKNGVDYIGWWKIKDESTITEGKP